MRHAALARLCLVAMGRRGRALHALRAALATLHQQLTEQPGAVAGAGPALARAYRRGHVRVTWVNAGAVGVSPTPSIDVGMLLAARSRSCLRCQTMPNGHGGADVMNSKGGGSRMAP